MIHRNVLFGIWTMTFDQEARIVTIDRIPESKGRKISDRYWVGLSAAIEYLENNYPFLTVIDNSDIEPK